LKLWKNNFHTDSEDIETAAEEQKTESPVDLTEEVDEELTEEEKRDRKCHIAIEDIRRYAFNCNLLFS